MQTQKKQTRKNEIGICKMEKEFSSLLPRQLNVFMRRWTILFSLVVSTNKKEMFGREKKEIHRIES